MHPFFSVRYPITFLALVSLMGGCAASNSVTTASMPTASPPAATPAPAPTPAASPSPTVDAATQLAEAEAQANQATQLASSAQSRDDWALVASRWDRAIALLSSIPESAPEAAQARQRIQTYQQSLASAQQQANRPITNTAVRLERPAPTEDGETAEGTDATAEGSEAASPEAALVAHLSQIGARMYGTYWCSYCRQQRELFGIEAAEQVANLEIECDARGSNPQVEQCRAAGVASFPTWEINGELYRGLQSLNQLADASGYTGPREFSN